MDLKNVKTGAWVLRVGQFVTPEKGRIKSWNESYVFVVYHCDNNWDNFEDYTAHATKPQELMLFLDPVDIDEENILSNLVQKV